MDREHSAQLFSLLVLPQQIQLILNMSFSQAPLGEAEAIQPCALQAECSALLCDCSLRQPEMLGAMSTKLLIISPTAVWFLSQHYSFVQNGSLIAESSLTSQF